MYPVDQASVRGMGLLKGAEICSLNNPQAPAGAPSIVDTHRWIVTAGGTGEKEGKKVLLCPGMGYSKGLHFRASW